MVEDIYDASEKSGHRGHACAISPPAWSGSRTWTASSSPSATFRIRRVFKGQIETDADGYILSKGGARTNIPGVFHAGDVQDRTYRQAITASGAGCMAAIEAERFLEAEGH